MTTAPEIAAVLEGRAQWALVLGDCREVLPTLPEDAGDVVTEFGPLERLGHFAGSERHERALHEAFAPFHVAHEWFRPAPVVLELASACPSEEY